MFWFLMWSSAWNQIPDWAPEWVFVSAEWNSICTETNHLV